MAIRAKLYAAIVLTILRPLATTAVALTAMASLGDRFGEVRESGTGVVPPRWSACSPAWACHTATCTRAQ